MEAEEEGELSLSSPWNTQMAAEAVSNSVECFGISSSLLLELKDILRRVS